MKRIWFFIIPLVIFFLSISTVSAATINKPTNFLGMVGYWTFDGSDIIDDTALDKSGQGNNGTLTYGPEKTTGKIGQAMSFDGINDRVDLASTITAGSDATYSFWVKPTGTTYRTVFGANVNEEGAQITPEGSIGIGNGTNVLSSSNGAVPNNAWTHVVFTWDGTNTKVYINSSLDNQTNANAMSDVALIGIDYTGAGDEFMHGSIDDVRIYNRALSAAEVSSLYNSGQAKVSRSTNDRLTDGLVGLWSFDGKDLIDNTAVDRSGNGNDGTLTNGPTVSAGKIGQAMSFDGVDDYVDIADDDSLDFDDEDFSIAFWIKASEADFTNGDRVFGKGTSSGGCGAGKRYDLYYHSGRADGARFLFTIDDNVAKKEFAFNENAVLDDSWHHVVLQKDATASELIVYLDGSFDSSDAETTGSIANGCSLLLGRTTDDAGVPIMSLDDFRVYRRLLSATEIKQLYNIGSADKINRSTNDRLTDGLVGLWSFDGKDLIDSTAVDGSGNGNDGTLTNGPTVSAGKIGQALYFDGDDDYVNLSSPLFSSYPLTTCGWIKPRDFGGTDRHYIYYQANHQFYVRQNSATPTNVQVGFYNNISSISSPTNVINMGEWNHVCGTVDSSNQAYVYVNGVVEAGPTTMTEPPWLGSGYYIGRAPSFYSYGDIDDVRAYNRDLSATEIKQLYDMGH